MEYETVKYLGVELFIHFEVNGKHYPATRETPEEFPDIIIRKVTTLDSCTNLINILIESQIDDLQNLLYDKL